MVERDIMAMMLMMCPKATTIEKIANEYEQAIKAVEDYIVEYYREKDND